MKVKICVNAYCNLFASLPFKLLTNTKLYTNSLSFYIVIASDENHHDNHDELDVKMTYIKSLANFTEKFFFI